MLREQKETVGLADGGDAMRARFQKSTEVRPTLSDIGIDKKLSSRAQQIAAVPENDDVHYTSEDKAAIRRGVERLGRP